MGPRVGACIAVAGLLLSGCATYTCAELAEDTADLAGPILLRAGDRVGDRDGLALTMAGHLLSRGELGEILVQVTCEAAAGVEPGPVSFSPVETAADLEALPAEDARRALLRE
jgi:hypothetical protein